MTPVEIMALILAIVIALKLIVVLIKPKAWLDGVVKPVWKNPAVTMIISLILAAVTLYYLNASGIGIVQIFATMLFLVLLFAVGISVYFNEIMAMATKMLKNKAIIKKSWLYILIWIALTVWVLYALLI